MRDTLCSNVRRQGDCIPVMNLTDDELDFVLRHSAADLTEILTDDEEAEAVLERFRIEKVRRALGL